MPLGRPLYEPTRDTKIAGLRRDVERLKRREIPIPASVGVTTESLYLDSSVGSIASSEALADGAPYLITVQGTYSVWNEVLDVGTPDPDATFPGSTGGRVSTEVGLDAECIFAKPHDATPPLGHTTAFEIDLGAGYAHTEPDDGSHGSPVSGHLYKYTVTGQGSPVSFRNGDTGFSDNYGKLFITIQALDGTSTGGGGGAGGGSGSLVPPADSTKNTDVLTVVAGVPAWAVPIVRSVLGRTGAVVAADGDYYGVVAAAKTGAVQAARFAGATASGAPATGTFLKGDFVVAQNGHIFVCTVAGSPGTWVDAGSVGNLVTSVFGRTGAVVAANGDYSGVVAAALAGATAATRFVGGTASGAPATGTFAVGDFVVAQNGHIFVCTVAGTPGTWVDAGGSAAGISTLTSTGSSITITSPTGPTANVEVATVDGGSA